MLMRFLGVVVLLLASAANAAAPSYTGTLQGAGNGNPERVYHRLVFDSTTDESRALDLGAACSVRFTKVGAGNVVLYEIGTPTTAATSGDTETTFVISTTAAYTFNPGLSWAKVKPAADSAGSVIEITCTNLSLGAGGAGSGSRTDVDGDGLYEVAYLWDADLDGSQTITCTGDATPDIGCKATGEKLNRDTIDDLNCAMLGCGNGQMEVDGTIILGSGVWLGFPCWNASAPGNHTPENAETTDDNHDTAVSDAAYANCPVDPDGFPMKVISTRDWQGTLVGEGQDTRRLERGSMSASLRRDQGTYLLNDMGPWDVSNNNNVWFSGGDNERMISSGFHNNVSDTNHPNGGRATDSSTSKGWWRVYVDVNFTNFVTDNQMICLRDEGGTVGTDYKTVDTVSTLRAGDVLLLPTKPYSGGAYNLHEVVVLSTPSATCGGSSQGFWVNIGGTDIDRTNTVRNFPPHSNTITAADGQHVSHARSGYDNTRLTVSNMTIGAQDPWNEFGGRCTNSGTAWKTLVTSTGTAFSTATDDTNTDLSCDTLPLFGLWGGGHVTIRNVTIADFHKYALDSGGTGYVDIEDVRFIYGKGQEIADGSNGWRFKDIFVDQSYFISSVINFFGVAPWVDGLTLRNSTFSNAINVSGQSPMANIQNVRNEGNSFLHTLRLSCGAQFGTYKDIFQSGRGNRGLGGSYSSNVFIECDDTANLVTHNVFENIIVDAPDAAGAAETAPVITFNVPAASGNSADAQWGAIVGNTFRGVRSNGYVGGTAGESACLYAVAEADADSPADDDGESVIFTKNFFDGGSVDASGRIFCMTNSDSAAPNHQAIDSTGAATPAWGDPQGCGNMDGGVVYADENCQ